MESMDSLESMLQSIQRQQYMLMNHLNVDDSSRSLKVEGARLTHAAIRRAVSTGVGLCGEWFEMSGACRPLIPVFSSC